MAHHHELAAMQSLHAQQLESLSLRHQQELLRVEQDFADGESGQEYRHSSNTGSSQQQSECMCKILLHFFVLSLTEGLFVITINWLCRQLCQIHVAMDSQKLHVTIPTDHIRYCHNT